MANEAFALSPVPAPAPLPGEAEYNLIRDAFMETSRGRWFLSEYARRNRNADTRMVLDAVQRIEASLAAQRPAGELYDAIAAIRGLIEKAKAGVLAELARLESAETLTPAYKDAQATRKIIWTLRECGTDFRLCDLLDAQAKAIETSLELLAAAAPRDAVAAIFARLLTDLDSFAKTATPPQAAAAEAMIVTAENLDLPGSSPAAENPAPAAEGKFSPANEKPDDAVSTSCEAESIAFDDARTSPTAADDDIATRDAETAQDDQVLDLIAMEMAAPDTDEAETPSVTEPAMNRAPELGETAIQAAPQPQVSLGAALLANGTIRRLRPSHSDRFAVIRRMSQAERVALFS